MSCERNESRANCSCPHKRKSCVFTAHGAKLQPKSHVCGSARKKKIGMDEEQGGSQKLFRRAALKSQRRAALGSIHINIPSAFWAESLLVTAFVVATFVEVIAQILSSKPSDRRMPCNSIGNTPIRSLRIPDLAKNQEVGCPMESRSSSRPRFAVQLVVAAIICFASALGAGQKAVAANKGQPPSASVRTR